MHEYAGCILRCGTCLFCLSLSLSLSRIYCVESLIHPTFVSMQCDMMYDQEDDMVQDYLNNIDFEKMCEYLGVCWLGLCLPSC